MDIPAGDGNIADLFYSVTVKEVDIWSTWKQERKKLHSSLTGRRIEKHMEIIVNEKFSGAKFFDHESYFPKISSCKILGCGLFKFAKMCNGKIMYFRHV
jgi:hypothetical protein